MTVTLNAIQYKYIRDLLTLEKIALNEYKSKSFSRRGEVPETVLDELEIVTNLLGSVFFKE